MSLCYLFEKGPCSPLSSHGNNNSEIGARTGRVWHDFVFCKIILNVDSLTF